MKDFEIIPHTADLKIRVYGKTLKELFANALIAMFQSIKPINTEYNKCSYKNEKLVCRELTIKHNIELRSTESELLLVDFLSEALCLSDINNEAYLNLEVHELNETFIKATLLGIKIKGFEVAEIKAVTYHDLNIKFEEGYFVTDIVFDI